MRRYLIALSVLVMLTVFANRPAGAYLYGEGEKKQEIMVDKSVKSPLESDWHDNLSESDTVFAANDYVDFKIVIKNSGEQDLTNINLADKLPDQVKSVLNPGEYLSAENRIKWNIDKLTPGESKEFTIKAQVVSSDKLPRSSTFCVINRVDATSDQNQSDSDTAQFCINPKILGAKLPEAGVSLWLSTLIGGGLLGLGIAARKFGRGEIFA